jgi:hypothetical protein
MTREEFIEVLDDKGYSYEIEGNKIVVTGKGDVWLGSLTSLPSGVEFGNRGDVWLKSLIGDWFYLWNGNIKGIDKKRLLNKMIKDGVFER